jgi:hypothetical protein
MTLLPGLAYYKLMNSAEPGVAEVGAIGARGDEVMRSSMGVVRKAVLPGLMVLLGTFTLAGGSLITSTRPTLNRPTELSPHVYVSIYYEDKSLESTNRIYMRICSEGESCGLARISCRLVRCRFEGLLSIKRMSGPINN